MSHFNNINDCANTQLLTHAHEKHEEELYEHELRMKNLHSIICLQLREKSIHHSKMALIKQQIEDGAEMNREYITEVKFVLAIVLVVSVLMALQSSGSSLFFYLSPIYFLFVFYNLE